MADFKTDLTKIINFHSMGKKAQVPDFIIADYLMNCLKAFDNTMIDLDKWYNQEPNPTEYLEKQTPNVITCPECHEPYDVSENDECPKCKNVLPFKL
jgi:hypothetical protein